MKASPTNRHMSHRQRGMALVLVLGFLVLISGLVLAFFSSVQNELASAKAYASGANTKQLADTAVQIVMGAIRSGTSGGSGVAWASQPGMIRTYGTPDGKASSSPLAYYKLYSSDDMVVTNGLDGFNPADDVPTDWAQLPASYTDLNAPVAKEDGLTKSYPILDPASLENVEGFKVENAPEANTGSGTAEPNKIPMPVRWIYILRDGTLTTPDKQTGASKTASFIEADGFRKPTQQNPIVGRVAFWTDDETSKININTAAGDEKPDVDAPLTTPGSFWDIPRASTAFDWYLASKQVMRREFQRYPGHPSTVALNTVFPELKRDEIALLTPRVAFGGSEGGTTVTNRSDSTKPYTKIKPDADRLYASVDELLFKVSTETSSTRVQNLAAILTPEAIERSRFFLTAQSRAPELNLFGLPRVSMWPIHILDTEIYRTASDKLLAFCSNVGVNPTNSKPYRYYFSRGLANGVRTNGSRTLDFNARNQELYNYLRDLTSEPVPGFGGNTFASKVTTLERDQILTEIYDYIRSTNLVDGLLNSSEEERPPGEPYTPPKMDNKTGKALLTPGSAQVVPIKITTPAGDTKGFGRFATISEAALQFYATELKLVNGAYRASKMRAVLVFETFGPSHGCSGITPEYYHVVKGLEKLQVTVPGGNSTTSLNFPANATNRIATLESMHGRIWSGMEGCGPTFFSEPAKPDKKIGGTNPKTNYAFASQSDIVIDTSTNNQAFTFSGGDITLEICAPSTAVGQPGERVQVINLKFPEGKNWPLPKAPAGSPTNKDPLKPESLNYDWRIAGLNKHDIREGSQYPFQSFARLIDQADTVRSLEPSGPCEGDLRLVAGREDVPVDYFLPHPSYTSTTLMQAHSLRAGVGFSYPWRGSQTGTKGKLVPAATYVGDIQPDMPASLTKGAILGGGSGTTPGDWDNGMSWFIDGPYINKPDEGTTSGQSSSASDTPYFSNTDAFINAIALFSPNRQIASPVMLGSLPTGVVRGKPWQTLLFRPGAKGVHPGSDEPKDHLLLDLFWMPVVEPYAISEPCSTAGKVNMNYQIAPFTYIKRETALRAALQAVLTMGILHAQGNVYKMFSLDPTSLRADNYRSRIDASKTLAQFQKMFDSNRLFVSASEICDMELVPEGGPTAEGMDAYWQARLLTGDNVREMPYNHLYPLLTTKSNTYTVHFRTQTLKKRLGAGIPATDPRWQEWDESKDAVLGDYRGATLIERYIDPSDPKIPDFALEENRADGASLDHFPDPKNPGSFISAYKFRVLSTKKFGL